MPAIVLRLIFRMSSRGWRIPAIIVVIVFWIGWLLMWAFEPAGAKIRNFSDYMWYWIVTSSTTGYGEIVPVTNGGRFGGALVILTGLTAFLMLAGFIVSYFDMKRRRRMTGQAALHHRGHLVIIGCRNRHRIKEILQELRADGPLAAAAIVVCFRDGELSGENPDDGEYDVIDTTNAGWMEMAALGHAASILIDVGNDDVGIVMTLELINWLEQHKANGANLPHIAYVVAESARRKQITSLIDQRHAGIDIVAFDDPTMVADAIQNPGVAHLWVDLASNLDTGASLYRLPVTGLTNSLTWADVAFHLLPQGITLMAVSADSTPNAPFVLIPDPKLPFNNGSAIVVVASHRPTIAWNRIPHICV